MEENEHDKDHDMNQDEEHERVRACWDSASVAWADFVRDGKDIYRDFLNNPGMFALLGEVEGLKVLDLACGEGYWVKT